MFGLRDSYFVGSPLIMLKGEYYIFSSFVICGILGCKKYIIFKMGINCKTVFKSHLLLLRYEIVATFFTRSCPVFLILICDCSFTFYIWNSPIFTFILL